MRLCSSPGTSGMLWPLRWLNLARVLHRRASIRRSLYKYSHSAAHLTLYRLRWRTPHPLKIKFRLNGRKASGSVQREASAVKSKAKHIAGSYVSESADRSEDIR